MPTWIVGDIHGCAEELDRLVERLGLGPDDRLLSAGDLFHRGPDPRGVVEVLRAAGAEFILGNHELTVLKRARLAPQALDGSDRPLLRSTFPPLDKEDLAGDGGTPCHGTAEDRVEILRYLQEHSGFYLRGSNVAGAGPTADGRDWCLVHAGLKPGLPVEENSIGALTSMRRLRLRGNPWWYEHYEGEELVLFGHTHSAFPRVHHVRGRLAAIGLDTGCVYGGKLTAYSPELNEFSSVDAIRTWAAAA